MVTGVVRRPPQRDPISVQLGKSAYERTDGGQSSKAYHMIRYEDNPCWKVEFNAALGAPNLASYARIATDHCFHRRTPLY